MEENNFVKVTKNQFWLTFRPEHKTGESKFGDEIYYCTPTEIGKMVQGGKRVIMPGGEVLYYIER